MWVTPEGGSWPAHANGDVRQRGSAVTKLGQVALPPGTCFIKRKIRRRLFTFFEKCGEVLC